ncbi:hypothetical protein ACLOJK_005174 [Asimina triloba]
MKTIQRVIESISMVQLLNLTLTYPINLRSKSSNMTTSVEQYCRETVMTIWHYHGGCQSRRVVDHDYRVLGVDALRVIDGSTFNYSPWTNPQATVMMLGRRSRIGERPNDHCTPSDVPRGIWIVGLQIGSSAHTSVGAVYSKTSSPSALCRPSFFVKDIMSEASSGNENNWREEEMVVSIFSLGPVQGTLCFKLHLPLAHSLSLPLAQGSDRLLLLDLLLLLPDPLFLPNPLPLLPDPLLLPNPRLLPKTHRPPSIAISLLPTPNEPIDFPSSSSRSPSQRRAFTLNLHLSISLCLNVSFLSNLILLCPDFVVCRFLPLPIAASSASHLVNFDHPFTADHTQQFQCTATGYLSGLSVASSLTTTTLFFASRTFS